MRLTSDMRSVFADEVTDDDRIVGIDSRAVSDRGLRYWIMPGGHRAPDSAPVPQR